MFQCREDADAFGIKWNIPLGSQQRTRYSSRYTNQKSMG